MLDPTIYICKINDSFSTINNYDTNLVSFQDTSFYKSDINISPKDFNNFIIKVNPDLSYFFNSNKFDILQSLRPQFFLPDFLNVFNLLNPFNKIPDSVFFSKQSIILANIDSLFHLTSTFSFTNMQNYSPFSYCDISDNIGFVEYLQYRFPNSNGHTINHSSLSIDLDHINSTTFLIFDPSSNLFDNYSNFISFLNSTYPNGLDLFTSNLLYNTDESIHCYFLFVISYICLSCLKPSGNFLFRINDCFSSISSNLLFSLSLCFDSISIFKPVTTDVSSPESYVICKSLNSSLDIHQSVLNYLFLSFSTFSNSSFLYSLNSDILPLSFIHWLTSFNNFIIDLQLNTAKLILTYIKTKSIPSHPSISNIFSLDFNYSKFNIIWNLPDKSISF